MRNKGKTHDMDSLGGDVKLTQSSDILAPYILACNRTNGNLKMISMALNGIYLLLNCDLVRQDDVKNILRVLQIQVKEALKGDTSYTDVLPKILQILLQMATYLCNHSSLERSLTTSTLDDATFCTFLSLTFQLCRSGDGVMSSSSNSSKNHPISSSVSQAAQVQTIIFFLLFCFLSQYCNCTICRGQPDRLYHCFLIRQKISSQNIHFPQSTIELRSYLQQIRLKTSRVISSAPAT